METSDIENYKRRLVELRIEHRDLDAQIQSLNWQTDLLG
jgi:hypothetical protein